MKEGERASFLAAAGEEDGLPPLAQPESLQSPLIDGKYAKGWTVPPDCPQDTAGSKRSPGGKQAP